MKVVFYSYPSAFQNPGGGEIQLLKTKEYLERSGIEVKLFDQWNDKFEDYDILHVFGSVKDCVGIMQTALNKGVKVALSTIFWSSYNRALNECSGPVGKADLLIRHTAKLLFPRLPSGRRKTMALSDILFPNSFAEKDQLIRLFGMSGEKIHVVPNGIDPEFLETDPTLFKSKYGIEGFVLAIGRIEPRKNQLNLIRALKGRKIKLVIVGEPVSDYPDYYKKCLEEADKNVIFTGGFRHGDPMLLSAYAACRIFAAPGWFETPGLAALEAAASGARIAITKHGCTGEYFGENAAYFDPADIGSISAAIDEALNKEDTAVNVMKNRIIEKYLWSNTVQETKKGYELLLGE